MPLPQTHVCIKQGWQLLSWQDSCMRDACPARHLHLAQSPDTTMRGTWISIRGHEIRSARLEGGIPVAVAAGDEVVVQGLSEVRPRDDGMGLLSVHTCQ